MIVGSEIKCMARTTEQKIKLLVLYDLLCKYTDADHHLTTNQIVEMLTEKGIDVSRKVIPSDIGFLLKRASGGY